MRFRMMKRLLCVVLATAVSLLLLELMMSSNVTSSTRSPFLIAQTQTSHNDTPDRLTTAAVPWDVIFQKHHEKFQKQFVMDSAERQQFFADHPEQRSFQRGQRGQGQQGQKEAQRARAQVQFIPTAAPRLTTPSPREDLWENIIPGVGHGIKRPMSSAPKPTTCTPKHHVYFLKVHKTGSSTVANILQRYGFTRQLNFVLPRRRLHSASYNYLNQPGQPLNRNMIIPHPKGEHYDILWNHGIYDGPFFRSIMPNDTVYVSILREPLQQFQSAFEYYGLAAGTYLHKILQSNVSNPLSEYLRHPHKYQSPYGVAYLSYVKNKQAQDFGMRAGHILNGTLRRQYIEKLGEEFHLVMITEFFDESLVLLRRLLCWEIKDILYIPKNKNVRKKTRTFTDQDKANHRRYSEADYDLYEFFRHRFEDAMESQQIDFQAELGYFKYLLQKVQVACSQYGGMTVSKSPWNTEFEVTVQDCKLMQKSELPFLDDIIMDAVKRYRASV